MKSYRSFFRSDARRHEFLRFLVVGAINSAAAYLTYLLFLLFLPYPVAYSISYLAGICYSYYLNVRVVFRSQLQLSSALSYPAVYVVQYVLGLALLYLLVTYGRVEKAFAPLIVVVLTIPLTYLLSRRLLRRRRED